MGGHLPFYIQTQPTDTTCGPTCLQAVYRYYGLEFPLQKVISEVKQFHEGGTLSCFLGNHALAHGFEATILTYNLQVFDPTWFDPGSAPLAENLHRQLKVKFQPKLVMASHGYLEFLARGGRITYEELTPNLLRHFLKAGMPVITGLSSTYLHHAPREIAHTNTDDPIKGEPAGHFVVLRGYDVETKKAQIADPLPPHHQPGNHYSISMSRLIGAVFLGALTQDADLLVIRPKGAKAK